MATQRLSILGIGLLGGSLGLAVKSAINGCEIIGYAHRKQTAERAVELGVVDRATTDLKQAIAGSDLLVLCTPVGAFQSTIKEISPWVEAGTIVTDVGSTKRSVVGWAEELLPKGVHFVGSHPMAGSEKRGVEYARADLFQGATCILTPDSKTHRASLKAVSDFWTRMGMKTVQMSPAAHDLALAQISHLPHALAAALVAMQAEPSLDLCGKGFIDTTRIASGDGGLWRDILHDNRDNIRQAIDKLKGQLDHLSGLLEPSRAEELKNWLDAAAQRRDQLMQRKLRELNPD